MVKHGGKPINIFHRSGFLGRVSNYIPAPIKAFGIVAGLAATTVVVAPALIILTAPPLICCAFLWRRRIRSLQLMANELHNQRWKDLASFHLQSRTSHVNASSANQTERIPIYVEVALENAILNNNQQLANLLNVKSADDVSYGVLQSLSQDFRLDPSGFTEKMSISEYPLLVNRSVQGVVRVISREEADSKKKKTRIEVECKNNLIILHQSNIEEDIIEGGGRPIVNDK